MLVRAKAGLTPNLRLVGTMAWVAFGRPAPSSVVNLALNKSLAARNQIGDRRGPRRGDGVEIDVRRKNALVPACAGRGARADQQRQRRDGADAL